MLKLHPAVVLTGCLLAGLACAYGVGRLNGPDLPVAVTTLTKAVERPPIAMLRSATPLPALRVPARPPAGPRQPTGGSDNGGVGSPKPPQTQPAQPTTPVYPSGDQ